MMVIQNIKTFINSIKCLCIQNKLKFIVDTYDLDDPIFEKNGILYTNACGVLQFIKIDDITLCFRDGADDIYATHIPPRDLILLNGLEKRPYSYVSNEMSDYKVILSISDGMKGMAKLFKITRPYICKLDRIIKEYKLSRDKIIEEI